MANKIQFKRGIKATLPVLSVGEPALCTDTGEVFIGGTSGNIGIAKASDLTERLTKTEIRNSPLEIGQWIDFHKIGSGTDYDGRIQLSSDMSQLEFFSSIIGGKKILDQRDYDTLQTAIDGCFKPSNYGVVRWWDGNYTIGAEGANSVFHGQGTVTVPANVFPLGTQITFIVWGTGFTFVPASGVVLNSKDNKRIIDGAFASATLICLSPNTWILIGALK